MGIDWLIIFLNKLRFKSIGLFGPENCKNDIVKFTTELKRQKNNSKLWRLYNKSFDFCKVVLERRRAKSVFCTLCSFSFRNISLVLSWIILVELSLVLGLQKSQFASKIQRFFLRLGRPDAPTVVRLNCGACDSWLLAKVAVKLNRSREMPNYFLGL